MTDERGRGTGEVAVLEVGVDRLLLGDEAEQRRKAGHRGGADDGHHLHGQPPVAEAVQLSDVARAHLVVDDPDEHEQRRLERAVGEQQHDAGLRDLVLAGPEEQHHEPELADGAVGEQQLEVALAHRTEPADEHRHRADDEHQHTPVTGGARRSATAGRRDTRPP